LTLTRGTGTGVDDLIIDLGAGDRVTLQYCFFGRSTGPAPRPCSRSNREPSKVTPDDLQRVTLCHFTSPDRPCCDLMG
jgi:hypothetical protein